MKELNNTGMLEIYNQGKEPHESKRVRRGRFGSKWQVCFGRVGDHHRRALTR